MSDWQQVTLAGGLIQLKFPPEWSWHPDELGGGAVPPERDCVFHVRAEPVEDVTELPNLSRMLASFLTYHVRPVATDELHSFAVGGGLGYAWQYMEEWEAPEERGPIQAIRVWVVGNERAWAFANFQGPMEEVRRHRQLVDEIVSSFLFGEDAP